MKIPVIAVCIAALGFASIERVDAQPAPALLAGAFTEEQAVRGQALYYERCLQCHGEDLAGVDKAPPLAGPQFTAVWNGESLWALVERIATMPPEKPGSLTRTENVDLLTYLLWFNGLPLGGSPLSDDQQQLSLMTFEIPAAGQ